MKTLYSTKVTATGGREGSVKSEDGVLDFKVEIPKELGGKGGAFTNPEQLFAAGYAACFDSALNLVARNSKIKLGGTSITAEVGIGSNENGGFDLCVNLVAQIDGVEREIAEDLLAKTHQVCPYSNATRGNIQVEISLK
ncbi:organic hydroperoxide resistance protein [Flavobacterium columnare NBRC 100251 = ATCC 23463]|uniref:Ohr subfamily peroxiredoxin n=2 Tax=Flavobacterium columnare TaxID=996 RepID=G8X4G8_FLACA|nr:organic hydroperoxide resistance protein [Flavobacterium columnare]AEW85393.1 Ohr subfamily peroxiredoxin [Flavobacterium columnare ATCC 49512]AMO19718.1 organic hydroperoxide resistance protein [Flavobacterium columnare]APT23150.1 organic hydroperoxide resistance protein [Flavobacterium columnare]AUX17650.1 organic hydroperoxide resistance protein [Flavobacterium columnare]MBF6652386.1 organic hydroperoxide resistance protein [Flavobacterium columnare]